MLAILPEPPEWKAILGFDFDDTLLLKRMEVGLEPDFFECVKWIRSQYGAAWGVCTGRSLYQMVEGFNEGKFPFLPDFIVAREREIYFPGQFGRWVPHDDWNLLCEKAHKKLFKKVRRLLGKVRKFVKKETNAEWVSVEGDEAGIVATSGEEMDTILAFVETLGIPDELSYERNNIYLRFSHADFNKGTGLMEAGRRWAIGPEQILAVGDNYNDLSMLQPEVCAASGCPSNAVLEVKQYISSRGGLVANQPGSLGVMEVLAHYFGE